MTSTWLKLDEINKETNIPIPTLNRYVKDYQMFLGGKKIGKPWKFPPESLAIFEKIKYYYDNGNTKEEIINSLSKTNSITIDIENESSNTHQLVTTNHDEIKTMVLAQNQILEAIAATLQVIADNKKETQELKEIVLNLSRIVKEKEIKKTPWQGIKNLFKKS